MSEQNTDREPATVEEVREYYVTGVPIDSWLESRAEYEERFDRFLAAHDAEVAAKERERCAQIAEAMYFGGGATGSANQWGAKQAAARIREGGTDA